MGPSALLRTISTGRDETPEQRRPHGIDSIYDEIGKISADREADQNRNRPDPESTCTRSVTSFCHRLNGVSHIGFLQNLLSNYRGSPTAADCRPGKESGST
jgi:hypothetical protein